VFGAPGTVQASQHSQVGLGSFPLRVGQACHCTSRPRRAQPCCCSVCAGSGWSWVGEAGWPQQHVGVTTGHAKLPTSCSQRDAAAAAAASAAARGGDAAAAVVVDDNAALAPPAQARSASCVGPGETPWFLQQETTSAWFVQRHMLRPFDRTRRAWCAGTWVHHDSGCRAADTAQDADLTAVTYHKQTSKAHCLMRAPAVVQPTPTQPQLAQPFLPRFSKFSLCQALPGTSMMLLSRPLLLYETAPPDLSPLYLRAFAGP